MLINTIINYNLNLMIPNKSIKVSLDAKNLDTEAQVEEVKKGEYLLTLGRDFLQNGTVFALIQAVSHECVHIAQFVTGINNCEVLEGIEYYFSPDEIQARGLERALAEGFYFAYDIEYIEAQPLSEAILKWNPNRKNVLEFPKK